MLDLYSTLTSNFKTPKVPISSSRKPFTVSHMLTKEILLTLLVCAGSVFAAIAPNPISACQGRIENAPCEYNLIKIVKPFKGACVKDTFVSVVFASLHPSS
jgi:hypothetical protein